MANERKLQNVTLYDYFHLIKLHHYAIVEGKIVLDINEKKAQQQKAKNKKNGYSEIIAHGELDGGGELIWFSCHRELHLYGALLIC